MQIKADVATWLGTTVNDFKTIEVVSRFIRVLYRMLNYTQVVLTDEVMRSWNSGWWAFQPGQHMQMQVHLRRDDGFQGKIHVRCPTIQGAGLIGYLDIHRLA
jgi:hypothetical protein